MASGHDVAEMTTPELNRGRGVDSVEARLQAQAAERDADEDPDERDQWAMEELMKLLLPEGN